MARIEQIVVCERATPVDGGLWDLTKAGGHRFYVDRVPASLNFEVLIVADLDEVDEGSVTNLRLVLHDPEGMAYACEAGVLGTGGGEGLVIPGRYFDVVTPRFTTTRTGLHILVVEIDGEVAAAVQLEVEPLPQTSS